MRPVVYLDSRITSYELRFTNYESHFFLARIGISWYIVCRSGSLRERRSYFKESRHGRSRSLAPPQGRTGQVPMM